MRWRIGTEDDHALLAQRDKHVWHLPFVEQALADFEQLRVSGCVASIMSIINACRSKGFQTIRLHQRGPTPVERIARRGIDRDELVRFLCQTREH